MKQEFTPAQRSQHHGVAEHGLDIIEAVAMTPII